MMNILFITEIEPFPPNSGESIRSYHLINSLLEFTDRLYLISGNSPPDEAKYRKIVYRQFPVIYSKNRWRNLVRLFFRKKSFTKIITDLINSEEIDIAFLDYKFIGNYIKLFKDRRIKVVYGTHNVQSLLYYQVPYKKLKDVIYKNISFVLRRAHELYYFRFADAIIAVSDVDLKFYSRFFRKSKLHLIPNYIHEKEYEEDQVADKKNRVIMSGNFTAFQNQYGLRWFIEEVWDDELASLTNFIIVGHGSINQFNSIKEKNSFIKNVSALGTVVNMKKYIAESKAAIIPLLHGSGTRLKCIEAMALKTNIVSTSLGAEGINHKGTILTADSASDFKRELIRILKDEIQNQDAAYAVFLDQYSSHSITPLLKEITHSLI